MTADPPQLEVFPTPAEVAGAARDELLPVLAGTARERPVHLVLAGGTSPTLLYRMLAQEDEIFWTNVHIWFGDERTVPPDHADSNFNMAVTALLSKIEIPDPNVHRMRGEEPPAEAARAYAEELRQVVPANAGGLPAFDYLILGMGDDGHTASLFPGTAALSEQEKLVAANEVPQLDTVRITLTYPAINAAASVRFLVTSAGKAHVLAAVMHGGDDAPPAAFVRPTTGDLRWYVDQAAAGKLDVNQVAR